jgi:hypothetical protein
MENSLDTKLTVRFKGTDGVSYEVLDSFLATICKEVHKYESDELKAYLDLRQDERITWPQIWKAGGVKTSPDSPEEQYECYLILGNKFSDNTIIQNVPNISDGF